MKNNVIHKILFFCLPLFFTMVYGKHFEEKNNMKKSYENFLDRFIPVLEEKVKLQNQASWILETTGAKDAVDILAYLHTQCCLMFSNKDDYEMLVQLQKSGEIKDLLQQREINVLIREFKPNMISPDLIKEISEKEAALSQKYASFRPKFEGQEITENGIRNILMIEKSPERRQKVWETSKEIGSHIARDILELVDLRNKAAQSLGYSDFFSMQIDLQEVDRNWLFSTLDELANRSEKAYDALIEEIGKKQAEEFSVEIEQLGPWAWREPYGQEDPLISHEMESVVDKANLVEIAKKFYQEMGFDITNILARSDLYERSGKNQHAFCINIDRKKDVRTLNNIRPTMRWMETLLHEMGHAVYELGFDVNLPWLLRSPPHMIPTEAMALIAGRQVYSPLFLKEFIPQAREQEALLKELEKSLIRRQMLFSRWVIVMTHFESELYKNPQQDLNSLWWKMVEKYQKIRPPQGREKKEDWAAKYHMGLAPVYYYSYLIGEMFASALKQKLKEETKSDRFWSFDSGRFLEKELFSPGDSYSWDKLIEKVLQKPLNCDPWLAEFAQVR